MQKFSVAFAFILLAACTKSPSDPAPTTPDPAAEEGLPDDEAGSGSAERPELTAAACEEQGGTVVGDIGDGAIHQPDYRCPESGEPPIATIVADADGPVAIEGAVCCK